MKNLEIFDLYQTNPEKSEKFIQSTQSSLRIQKDYQKVSEDIEWIEKMEETIPYIDNIFRNPNRFIVNEEEIVKIELARKITVESIKHLSKNTNFIQDYDKQTGDVRPSKILNINKEEDYNTYENRFIYTLVQNMKFFISRKERNIAERQNIEQKNNKQVDYVASSKVLDEKININIKLDTQIDSNTAQTDSILDRIAKLKQRIADVSSSEVYKIIDKKHITLITSPIKKTNVILKNVNFQYAVKLWNYLQENIDDKSRHIEEKEDTTDNEEIKSLLDETFFLNYLAINSLEKDSLENEEEQKEIVKETTEQMLEKIIDINSDLTEEQLQKLITDKYVVIKYKSVANINEIQKVFKKHIEKYLEKIQ